MAKVTAATPNNTERKVVIALIISTEVLSRLSPVISGESFDSKYANLIASWCLKFYEANKTAPGKAIEDVYAEWAGRRDKDDATQETVDKLLSGLSDEYEQWKADIIPDHMVTMATRYFGKVKRKRLAESLQETIEAGDDMKAEQLLSDYEPLTGLDGGYTDGCHDSNLVRTSLDFQQQESLVNYNGGLALFFGDCLREDTFIAFQGSDKSGKSLVLLDMAFRAMCERRRVLFFEAGDMGMRTTMNRWYSRAAHRPLRAGDYYVPREMLPGNDAPRVLREKRTADGPLTYNDAWNALRKIQKTKVKSEQSYFKIKCFPADTLKVEEIRSRVIHLTRIGWKPDLVVCDYADILCPPYSKNADTRDQTNAIWKQLRSLSQEQHCLVVTATQANAKTYGSELMTRQNFSEDKRKLAHVSGLIGLNVTTKDREEGLSRWNWIVRRDDAFSDRRVCHVAGCLAISNPAMLSLF